MTEDMYGKRKTCIAEKDRMQEIQIQFHKKTLLNSALDTSYHKLASLHYICKSHMMPTGIQEEYYYTTLSYVGTRSGI